jgi:hypothetical protein
MLINEIVETVPDPVNEHMGGEIHPATEKTRLKIRLAATIS